MNWLVTLFILFSFSLTNSLTNDVKLKLAQNYEETEDFEKAIEIYKELISQYPNNNDYFQKIKSIYLKLKKYNEAKLLLENQIQKTPNDITLYSELGNVYAKIGNDSLAFTMWNKTIQIQPKNFLSYKLAAESATENKFFEKAIQYFLQFRTATNDESVFASEIASLYAIVNNFENATLEYLTLLNETPQQIQYVQGKLSTFTNKQEGIDAAIKILNEKIENTKTSIALKKILAFLLMEEKKFGEAKKIYFEIDKLTQSNGGELFHFAEKMFKEKEFLISAETYFEIKETYKNFSQINYVDQKFAEAIEELANLNDTTKKIGNKFEVSFHQAILIYNEIVNKNLNNEIGAKTLFKTAKIQFEKFHQTNNAISTLTKLEQLKISSPLKIDGKIFSAEIFIFLGDTTSALSILQSIVEKKRILPSQIEETKYKIAEINFFSGNFTTALQLLNDITKNLLSDFTNDALNLKLFIEDHLSDKHSLQQFAKGMYLTRQKKIDDAKNIFEKIVNSELSDDATIEIAIIYFNENKFDKTIETYNKLLNEFKESNLLDKATFNLAKTYERVGEKNKSIEFYEQLLEKFPKSIYLDEARKKIRELRGDKI